MKRIQIIGLSILTVLFTLGVTGCKTGDPKMTKAFVKSAVQTGVAIGVSQKPEAIPYLRIATPIVCEASRGTNVQPDYIVEALQNNAAANQLKNAEAILIFNSAFGIYTGLYEAYGAEGVSERAQLQAWLSGVCEGLLAGLPPVPSPLSNVNKLLVAKPPLPPHVK